MVECVESVLKHTQDYELLVVDNASTDGSPEKVSTVDKDIRIIRNPSNLSFSEGNNIGIRKARGRCVVLLSADTTVTEGWLDELEAGLETGPSIGLTGPKLLRRNGIIDSTGHVFGFKEGIVKDRGQGEPDVGQYDTIATMPSCCFACVLIKRDVFDQIGLLDEKLMFYFEDVDFCMRARVAGWGITYCPTSVVYHHRGGLTPKVQSKFLQIRSRPYMLRIILKTYETRNVLAHILYRAREVCILPLAVVAGVKNRDLHYSRFKVSEVGWFLRSLLWNVLRLPLKERIVVQRLRRTDDSKAFFFPGLTPRRNVICCDRSTQC